MTATTLAWPALTSFCTPTRKPEMTEPAAPTDEGLVAAAIGGDDGSFEELVRRYKRRVFGSASRFARDDHQLDDICQEIFVRAYRNLAKFRGDAPFEHWLARITISACYDFLRRERRVREQVPLDGVDWNLRDESCEAAVRAGRAKELLAWALPKLAAEEQLILTLCELEERPLREVAALTGWSETNVKVRAFRARQSLKKLLEISHER
jgi:RNA polymerase sigma-70 factor (ECF subfamily)